MGSRQSMAFLAMMVSSRTTLGRPLGAHLLECPCGAAEAFFLDAVVSKGQQAINRVV
jgi:hypothetical protein